METFHKEKQSEEIEPLYEEYIHEQNYHAQKGKKETAKDYVIAKANGTF